MKVFVVGVSDAEANRIVSIHETYDGALKAWNKEREELIKAAKRMKFFGVARGWSHQYDDDCNESIIKLSCEDPEKIDNYPHDAPYIAKYEVLP